VNDAQTKELAAYSKQIAEEEFKWSHIADQYMLCINKEI